MTDPRGNSAWVPWAIYSNRGESYSSANSLFIFGKVRQLCGLVPLILFDSFTGECLFYSVVNLRHSLDCNLLSVAVVEAMFTNHSGVLERTHVTQTVCMVVHCSIFDRRQSVQTSDNYCLQLSAL